MLRLSVWAIFMLTMVTSFAQNDIRLIIRVDDMGCSHATNTAIIKTFETGIATSVEVMVPAPWFPEAVQILREHPEWDAGIHLVLTSEWTNVKWRPLTYAPSLTDSMGYFYPILWPNARFGEKRALREHDWKLAEVEQEFRAQIELAKREIPRLSHMSAHMGCTSLSEEVKLLVQKLGKEYGLDIFLEDYNVQPLRAWRDNKISAEEKIAIFIELLEALEAGTYMFLDHPAEGGAEMEAIHHPGYEYVSMDRDGVLQVLTNPQVKATIEKRGIQLISYKDLKP